MSIKEIQEQLLEDFAFLDDWTDKYQYIMDIGKSLASMDDKFHTDDYLIKGCQSKVWLHSFVDENGNVHFEADSDALISKGLVALLVKILSGQSPSDIVSADLFFLEKTGLIQHLSPNRANGLASMLKQMRMDALVYQQQKHSA